MSASISHSFDSERPPASRPAAGAAGAEGVAAEHVNPQPGVVVADSQTAYRDSVEYDPIMEDARRWASATSWESSQRERVRLARLRRFQEQR